MDASQFGKLIKDIRHKHLTRDEIASRYNCHPNTIKNYENKGRMADVEYLALLAFETGYSFIDLITRRLMVAQDAKHLPADIDINQVTENTAGYSLSDTQGNNRKFTVHNDTMAPTIKTDAVITYDLNKTELKDGQMYVFSFDGEHQIRRIQISMTGAVKLICDNNTYPPETLKKSEVGSLHILGMVTTVTNFY